MRKSPHGLSVKSGLVCKCKGKLHAFWASSAVTFFTIPSCTIWFQASKPALALGEPGSRGLTLDLIGRLSPVGMACSILCLISLKFGVSISGNSLSNFWYGNGIGFGGVGGVVREATEKYWENWTDCGEPGALDDDFGDDNGLGDGSGWI